MGWSGSSKTCATAATRWRGCVTPYRACCNAGRAPMPDGAALSVRNVTKRFGGLTAVNAMTFELKNNEVLGLIGPNGSGKTTMINMMSGAFSPSSGEIKLHDQTISGLPAAQIAIAGLARTFQIVRML